MCGVLCCSSSSLANAANTNITGYVTLPSNEMLPLLEAVATRGPIGITIDASTWGRYESGVYMVRVGLCLCLCLCGLLAWVVFHRCFLTGLPHQH